jgi:RNA polymerase sigma-70 factor (ECF subfamily)
MMGGFHYARLWHFVIMWAMLGFVFGHLVMVVLHGWNNFVSMLTGWKKDADAEDCAQEAVLKAFKNIRQFRSEARFSTWLIEIAINEARMRRRKQRTDLMEPIEKGQEEEASYAPREFADWREIPSEALERKEVRERLAAALGSIGENYREVFVLRDMEQLSIEETAKALGISMASVKTRLLRAKLMWRDLLAPGLGGSWSRDLSFAKGAKPW